MKNRFLAGVFSLILGLPMAASGIDVQPATPSPTPSPEAGNSQATAQASRPSVPAPVGVTSDIVSNVTKMVEAGTDSAVIKAFIQNWSSWYSLNADDILRLHKLGADTDVLTTLIHHSSELQSRFPAANQPMVPQMAGNPNPPAMLYPYPGDSGAPGMMYPYPSPTYEYPSYTYSYFYPYVGYPYDSYAYWSYPLFYSWPYYRYHYPGYYWHHGYAGYRSFYPGHSYGWARTDGFGRPGAWSRPAVGFANSGIRSGGFGHPGGWTSRGVVGRGSGFSGGGFRGGGGMRGGGRR